MYLSKKMDLSQRKLTRAEWETIEVPVSAQEKQILTMILQGFTNVNIRSNETQSLFSFIKIDASPEMEHFLYKKYFEELMKQSVEKYGKGTPLEKYSFSADGLQGTSIKSMKSTDTIRLGQFLKLANLVDSGSDAKFLLAEGELSVNGEAETRRGRQLRDGDVVEYDGIEVRVVAQD